jgi:hypothetical protein
MTAVIPGGLTVVPYWWTLAAEAGHNPRWHVARYLSATGPLPSLLFVAPPPCGFTGTALAADPADAGLPHCLECQRFCSVLPPPLRESVRAVR